jgi:hypothetical protein
LVGDTTIDVPGTVVLTDPSKTDTVVIPGPVAPTPLPGVTFQLSVRLCPAVIVLDDAAKEFTVGGFTSVQAL